MKNYKKWFSCSLSVVLFLCAFSVGCNNENNIDNNEDGKEIEYSETEPVYEKNVGSSYNMESIVYYTNYGREDYDSFSDFYDYYSSEFRNTIDGGFYLLRSDDGITDWVPYYLYKEIQIFQGKENPDDYAIDEYFMLKDSELGNVTADSDNDGGSSYNIILNMVLFPVSDQVTGNDYTLKFGNNYDGTLPDYINVYVGETCIGTCYYYARAEVTYSWFSQYFKNNLFRA